MNVCNLLQHTNAHQSNIRKVIGGARTLRFAFFYISRCHGTAKQKKEKEKRVEKQYCSETETKKILFFSLSKQIKSIFHSS